MLSKIQKGKGKAGLTLGRRRKPSETHIWFTHLFPSSAGFAEKTEQAYQVCREFRLHSRRKMLKLGSKDAGAAPNSGAAGRKDLFWNSRGPGKTQRLLI